VQPRTLALLLVVAAGSACNAGSVASEDFIQWTRQTPPSTRDLPPSVRDNPVSHCPPCGRTLSCRVGGGRPVIVPSSKVDGGACELQDSRTDIVVLQCDGSVATSTGRDVGSWRDDGQGNIVVELPAEMVDCS
jgi:hypothetical protein